ncbi:MAG: DUF4199 domain-containing protein, partial [Bacteroidota bacterium]
MLRKAIIFGLAAGAINIVVGFFTMRLWETEMDFSSGELWGYVSMLLALSMVYVGVKSYRDKELGGSISYGKAFSIGIGIVLIASIVYVIGWILYFNFMMPDFADKYLEHAVAQIEQSNSTEAEKKMQIEDMKS